MARTKRYNGYLRKSFLFEGKRIYVYAKTKEELLSKELEKRQELEQGEQNLYNPTLNAYYHHYTEVRRKQVRESTIRGQKCQFENISNVVMANNRTFGEMRIKDITRRDIEYTRQSLLDAGKTPQNLNICYSHLNSVFNSAVIDETIIKNPCKALKKLKRDVPPITETRHRALSIEETVKFFEVAETRNSFYINAFKMMIQTGLRVGELGALKRGDIDRINRFIYIRHTISRTETGSYYVQDDAKTMSGIRDIPLSDDILKTIRSQENLNRIIFGFNYGDLLFTSIEGEILREYALNREIKRICKQADIEYFTCHAFRNTFATRFIEQRPQDYKILSEILGHKDVSITLNLYTHVMTENKVNAMNDLQIKIS